MPKKITKLTNLKTIELTLTKRGANNKVFALAKGGVLMDPEVLLALVNTPAEGEEEFVETLKSMNLSEEEHGAAVAQYRVQRGMRDLVSDDLMGAVTKSAGYQSGPNTKQKPQKIKKSEVNLSGLDDETRNAVESVFKSNQDLINKSAEMQEVIKSLAGQIKDLEDNKLENHYVSKAAKDYRHLPMTDKDLGLMLKSAHDMNPDFAKGFESLLSKMDGIVEKSAAFTTMGAVSHDKPGGVWDKIEKMADSMVQKSVEGSNPINKHQAIDLVLKTEAGNQLYLEYLGENPKQRGEIY